MMTPGAQTTGDIAVYGSAKQFVTFFTFYAATCAEKCNQQLVVATAGAFTLTSVVYVQNNLSTKIRKRTIFIIL